MSVARFRLGPIEEPHEPRELAVRIASRPGRSSVCCWPSSSSCSRSTSRACAQPSIPETCASGRARDRDALGRGRDRAARRREKPARRRGRRRFRLAFGRCASPVSTTRASPSPIPSSRSSATRRRPVSKRSSQPTRIPSRRSRAAGLLGVLGLARLITETERPRRAPVEHRREPPAGDRARPDERRREVQPRARAPAREWRSARRRAPPAQTRPPAGAARRARAPASPAAGTRVTDGDEPRLPHAARRSPCARRRSSRSSRSAPRRRRARRVRGLSVSSSRRSAGSRSCSRPCSPPECSSGLAAAQPVIERTSKRSRTARTPRRSSSSTSPARCWRAARRARRSASRGRRRRRVTIRSLALRRARRDRVAD